MSFFNVEQAKARLNRSELAVPGSQPQMFEKAAGQWSRPGCCVPAGALPAPAPVLAP